MSGGRINGGYTTKSLTPDGVFHEIVVNEQIMAERDIERAQESARAADEELARWNSPNGLLSDLRDRRKSRIEHKETKDT